MTPGAGREGAGTPVWLAVPLAVGAVLLVLLTFPVSMPLIGLLHALEVRRLRAAAASMRCVRCGQVLGRASLDAADAAWAAEMAELQRRFPGTRFRTVRRCHALCAACGTGYGWNDRDRRLHPLVDDDPGRGGCRPAPSTRAAVPS